MILLPIAFLFDLVLGDPNALYRRVPHPIIFIGNGAAAVEKRLNRASDSSGISGSTNGLFWRGLVGWLVIVGGAAMVGAGLHIIWVWAIGAGWLAWALVNLPLALFASAFIAHNSLAQFVGAVGTGLDQSLDQGREAVGHIVGRKTDDLDASAVARAAIESLAENFSDGVIAPLFWLAVAGFPGLLAYKAINTLDSMWGYRNARYAQFGKAAARLDDAANWIPARLSGLIIIIASQISRQACAIEAWRAMVRDARLHASPNAGWPEAAMAGGLGILLGGPRQYGDAVFDAPYIGRKGGAHQLDQGTIGSALRLYRICGFVTLALCILTALIAGA